MNNSDNAAVRENGRKGGRPPFKWLVYVAYDCRLGERGKVLSKHTNYDLATLALNRSGYSDFLGIKEI